MSSEKRIHHLGNELQEIVDLRTRRQLTECEFHAEVAKVAKELALLARTEAGAVCDKLRPGAHCQSPDSCRENGCSAVERELLTHPQDASGDAEFSAAELESLAKCVLASVTPGGFHIPEGWNVLLDKLAAMQAKETK